MASDVEYVAVLVPDRQQVALPAFVPTETDVSGEVSETKPLGPWITMAESRFSMTRSSNRRASRLSIAPLQRIGAISAWCWFIRSE